ncbi:MAG: glycosyltransferase [Planctomycetes bacterium]|nr:glycosyltransferase [Planctomycetota bacterium]
MQVHVLSLRNCSTEPAWGCVVEFENVIQQTCDAVLITPEYRTLRDKLPRPIRRLVAGYKLEHAFDNNVPKSERLLVLVGLSPRSMEAMGAISDLRSVYGKVCAYIFDAWEPHFQKYAALFDHIFIPLTGTLDRFRSAYRVPVDYVPLAADVLNFGENRPDRYIDLLGYGRQYQPHSDYFAKEFNRRGSGGTYYHTTIDNLQIPSFEAHRRLFWQILRQSKLALAYDHLRTPSVRKFSAPMLGQRWFECLACGCAIVGWRPRCADADELMDWPDATIELSESPERALDEIHELLSDKPRLDRMHHNNFIQALARHDWRHRLAAMFTKMNLPLPDNLTAALSHMQYVVDQFRHADTSTSIPQPVIEMRESTRISCNTSE